MVIDEDGTAPQYEHRPAIVRARHAVPLQNPVISVMSANINRRHVLALGALLLSPAARVLAVSGDAEAAPLYLSAASTREDQHFLVGFRHDGTALQQGFQLQLPERGHHVAVNQQRGILVSIARRPGTTLVLADATTGEFIRELTTPADRHLYGHGVFSADGNWFYTTENAFDDDSDNSGRLVSWRVTGTGRDASLERVHDRPGYGVGPHELLLMPDGDTLVIANGGIRTHPSHDRDILNLDTMQPSLAYVDRHSGVLLEQQFLPEEFHQSSIRHLDVNAAGTVVLGMQFEGEAFMTVPLVATHRRGEPLQLLLAPPEVQPQLNQYVGAIRFAADGRHVAASCPRGNQLTIWDADSGQLLHALRARDNCGVIASRSGFVYSTGLGKVAELDVASGQITEFDGADALSLLWDNHLCAGATA